jgi:type I restriction enzyme R subunit
MSSDDGGYINPEQQARRRIDVMLTRAGWVVQNYREVNLEAGVGVAVREVPTEAGPADYLLFVDAQAVGVIEAKKAGTTLSGVEPQTLKYQANVPGALPAYRVGGLLPFGYESTGTETWFTCRFDSEPTARRVHWFHSPDTLHRQVADQVRHGRGSLRSRIGGEMTQGTDVVRACADVCDAPVRMGADDREDALR